MAEGFTGENGWSIPEAPTGSDADEWDAEHFYALMEDEIIPLFFERDKRGIPVHWFQRVKHALKTAGEQFTARYMVQRYARDFYLPIMRGDPFEDLPPTV
jgi:starch phosphorylase